MSPLTDAMIINGAVLVAVLEGDLGPHRKIGKIRILWLGVADLDTELPGERRGQRHQLSAGHDRAAQ